MSIDSVRILCKLGLLAAPGIVFFGLPLVVILASGELTDVRSVVRRQASPGARLLYGPAYSNPCRAYKMESVRQRRPDVVALGSSRVMKLRGQFFRDPASFFNAGGGADNVYHFRQFLNQIPLDGTPRLIVAGIDQWDLNPNWHGPDWDRDLAGTAYRVPDLLHLLQQHWREINGDVFLRGKWRLRDVVCGGGGRPTMGLQARAQKSGWRPDGSRDYGPLDVAGCQSPESPDFQFVDTFDRINSGSLRFEYGAKISEKRLAALESFLSECRDRRIEVVLFLPPLAHAVLEKMKSFGTRYDYLPQVAPAVRRLAGTYRYAFFDYTDMAAFGAPDAEAIDGFHGSEKTYARLLIEMTRASPLLQTYVDADAVQAALDAAHGSCDVFPD